MFSEEDVHKGLINSEARTFLAKEHSSHLEECSYSSETIIKQILALEAEIAERKKLLLVAQQREAIELIISSNGWEIHDIEGVVEFTNESYPFIGTEREFRQQFLVAHDLDY